MRRWKRRDRGRIRGGELRYVEMREKREGERREMRGKERRGELVYMEMRERRKGET